MGFFLVWRGGLLLACELELSSLIKKSAHNTHEYIIFGVFIL